MIQYIDQNTFKHNLQEGQNPKIRGHPTEWQKPYWWGDNIANQFARVTLNEPDGTRCYYDPVQQTYSFEHTAGHHHTITNNGWFENIAGCKYEYIASGHSYTVNGHLDTNVGNHHRENIGGDHYHNVKGVHHAFYQGGKVEHVAGNVNTSYGGHVKHSIAGVGPPGSYGVGVGPGDGTNHDNAMTMDKDHIWVQAYTNGDINIKTKNNDITITCGNTVTITATADIDVISQKNINANAAMSIVATAPTINVGADQYTKTINIGMGKQIINFNGGGPVVPPFTCV